jgi:GxxExxY protein
MHTDEEMMNQLTERIIGCAFKVANILGCGFAEKVYENAMVHELKRAGISVEQQKEITVYYDGVVVGEYLADLMVEGKILVELKAIRSLDDVHIAQCLNYLAATGAAICLLLNFGKRVEVKRFMNRKEIICVHLI